MRAPLLKIRNLCVDYVTDLGNARAVNNVDLEIFLGETVGLAGSRVVAKAHLHFP